MGITVEFLCNNDIIFIDFPFVFTKILELLSRRIFLVINSITAGDDKNIP